MRKKSIRMTKVEKVAADFRAHASDYLNGAVIPVDGGYLVK